MNKWNLDFKKNTIYNITKKVKYIDINLIFIDVYVKNYKTLVKKIKEDLDKWRNIPFSWIGTQYF